jgi:dTDP-4-amino-4,6-dideoxygalactose transaminase
MKMDSLFTLGSKCRQDSNKQTFDFALTGESNSHLFVVVTPERDALRRHLSDRGIPTLIHYPIPLPRQKAFAAFNPASCPNADRICAGVLSLPMSPGLSDDDARRVADGLRDFYQ